MYQYKCLVITPPYGLMESFMMMSLVVKGLTALSLQGMQDTLTQYSQFSETTVSEDSLPAYDRALKRLESVLPFEENLVGHMTVM